MSKFLEAIGIHAMTNREALMEELDLVTDAAFPLYLNEAVDVIAAAPPGWLNELCRADRILNPSKEENDE
ncbi:MAG: hypothetical protein IKN33_03415 [Selenomonadaceae bacterium]|nr:hypothetical protein [Selenomonadaceae bacterium]